MKELYLALALIGLFTLFFAFTSHYIKERLFLSEALVATIFGILIGPIGLQVFKWDGPKSQETLFYFSRLILAFQIMVSGMNLPKAYLKNKYRSLLFLLIPVTLFGWIFSSLATYLLLGDIFSIVKCKFNRKEACFVIGACISPTDPILSNSVLKGRFADQHIPMRIRYLISAERLLHV